MESKVIGKYQLTKKIGSGSFGEIYLGLDTETNEEVAIKLEDITAEHGQLLYESKVYGVLKGGTGIANMMWYGQDKDHNVMAMELLGPSLEDLFNDCNRKFSLKTMLMLTDQMITCLEYMHTKNFIHRDMKPENFLIGRGKKADTVFIIDFGLSKKYKDKNGQHIPYKDGRDITGTARYASINCHLGIEPTRRDDLESLGYLLLYLFKGKLPWQGIQGEDKFEKYRKIMEKKQALSITELCKGCPIEFQKYMTYVRKLEFEEKPDYQYLKGLFKDLFFNTFEDWDLMFDWKVKTKEAEKSSLPTTNTEMKDQDNSQNKPQEEEQKRESILSPNTGGQFTFLEPRKLINVQDIFAGTQTGGRVGLLSGRTGLLTGSKPAAKKNVEQQGTETGKELNKTESISVNQQ